MKKIISLFIMSQLVGAVGFATPFSDDFVNAEQTRQKYEQELMSIKGVTGVAVSLCDEKTGDLASSSTAVDDRIACILVMAEDSDTVETLEKNYGKSPTQLDNTMTVYLVTGEISAQPGGTSGNGIYDAL